MHLVISSVESAENRGKECNQFSLLLSHAMILFSKVRTSASKKINLMALTQTLAILLRSKERRKNAMVFRRLSSIQVSFLFSVVFLCFQGPAGWGFSGLLSMVLGTIFRGISVVFCLISGRLWGPSIDLWVEDVCFWRACMILSYLQFSRVFFSVFWPGDKLFS